MNRFITSLTLILTLSIAQTASADNMMEYFNAVLKSKALKTMLAQDHGQWSLKSIEKDQTFRCPGCFSFNVVTEKWSNGSEMLNATHSFMTEMNLQTQKISVKMMDQ